MGTAPDLLRLVYVSRAVAGLDEADLQSIAASSYRRNQGDGLSGFILYEGQQFHGVLEGPRRRVLAAMERIISDGRHSGVNILLETSIAERRFENWSIFALADPAGKAETQAARDFIQALSRHLR